MMMHSTERLHTLDKRVKGRILAASIAAVMLLGMYIVLVSKKGSVSWLGVPLLLDVCYPNGGRGCEVAPWSADATFISTKFAQTRKSADGSTCTHNEVWCQWHSMYGSDPDKVNRAAIHGPVDLYVQCYCSKSGETVLPYTLKDGLFLKGTMTGPELLNAFAISFSPPPADTTPSSPLPSGSFDNVFVLRFWPTLPGFYTIVGTLFYVNFEGLRDGTPVYSDDKVFLGTVDSALIHSFAVGNHVCEPGRRSTGKERASKVNKTGHNGCAPEKARLFVQLALLNTNQLTMPSLSKLALLRINFENLEVPGLGDTWEPAEQQLREKTLALRKKYGELPICGQTKSTRYLESNGRWVDQTCSCPGCGTICLGDKREYGGAVSKQYHLRWSKLEEHTAAQYRAHSLWRFQFVPYKCRLMPFVQGKDWVGAPPALDLCKKKLNVFLVGDSTFRTLFQTFFPTTGGPDAQQPYGLDGSCKDLGKLNLCYQVLLGSYNKYPGSKFLADPDASWSHRVIKTLRIWFSDSSDPIHKLFQQADVIVVNAGLWDAAYSPLNGTALADRVAELSVLFLAFQAKYGVRIIWGTSTAVVESTIVAKPSFLTTPKNENKMLSLPRVFHVDALAGTAMYNAGIEIFDRMPYTVAKTFESMDGWHYYWYHPVSKAIANGLLHRLCAVE